MSELFGLTKNDRNRLQYISGNLPESEPTATARTMRKRNPAITTVCSVSS